MNAENEFTIYTPYTITIPSCFLTHKGFKLFSYNLCVKDPAMVRPEVETTKKVICTIEQDCFIVSPDSTDDTDGFVYVSQTDNACDSLTSNLPRTLYCEIKAYDASSGLTSILGFSNPFTVTITEDSCSGS
ncbi:uncharacterized protein LOC129590229 isoform X2 [Paramacrobiotus metropolitanus]|nr:uncharacterized protein LOC129590229 isoform X2 [Paramacrobiotus metropolitanus]